MKNIKFQHVAILLALVFLVWLYMESKKKATAATTVAAKTASDDKGSTTTNADNNSSSSGTMEKPIIINMQQPYSRTVTTRVVGSYVAAPVSTPDTKGGGVGVGTGGDPTLPGGSGGGSTQGGGVGVATN